MNQNSKPNFAGLTIAEAPVKPFFNIYVLFDDLTEYAVAVDLTADEAVEMFNILWYDFYKDHALNSRILQALNS